MSSYVSVAKAIEEIEHWLRLECFLHDPMKNALLQVLHNKLNDPSYQGIPENPAALYQFFANNRRKLSQLASKKILKKDQYDLLLPPGGNQTFSSEFDVTLIALLIQNFNNLPPPQNGWNNKNPPLTDTSLAAFVIRAREWRNFLNHIAAKAIDVILFQQKWQDGCDIIQGLGYQYNTADLKKMSLDPKHRLVVKSLKSSLAKLKSNHRSLSGEVDTIRNTVSAAANEVSDHDQKIDDLEQKVAEIIKNNETQDKDRDTEIANLQNEVTTSKEDFEERLSDLQENFNEMANQIENISRAVELHNSLNMTLSISGIKDHTPFLMSSQAFEIIHKGLSSLKLKSCI